ncbi:MAG: carboxypeptidase M32 [Nitrospirota bacterium]|jgi:carboxypeptidase Taq
MRAYDHLAVAYRDLHQLRAITEHLHWDQATYLPAGGHGQRAAQLATLAALLHQQATRPELGGWLDRATDEALDPVEARNVALMRRDYRRRTAIPEALARETARVSAEAWAAWTAARAADDFAAFAPHLERVLAVARERAGLLADGGSPYETLLDEYEPGITEAALERLFTPLREGLAELVVRIRESDVSLDDACMQGEFPVPGQQRLAAGLVVAMGFDPERGRIDTTVHPFCSGTVGDVRLTTRYNLADVREGIGSIVHETGHGLYEQGLDPALADQPAGGSLSMGIHESQSRLWENQVARSRAGAAWLLGHLREVFPELFQSVGEDDVYRAMNLVAPGLIRTEADEVHYNLHILLRWEIERGLIAGDIPVADLPGLWRERMQAWLGVEVHNDRDGCLQDVHWSSDFGYFPAYTLGNLYAAQLYAAVRRERPDLDASIASGDLLPLRDWLRDRVHRHGSRLTQDELIRSVTGAPLSEEPLLAYLNAKFGELYRLD